MKIVHPRVCCGIVLLAFSLLGTSCDSDHKPITNHDPGNNDLNTVVALGDSITNGYVSRSTPYPRRLADMIGKRVINSGIPGSRATEGACRIQRVINQHRPAFMLIIYGANDVIFGQDLPRIVDALNLMIHVCRANHVVPVLATLPPQIFDHDPFGPPTFALNIEIRALARANGVRYVDLEREFQDRPELYMRDGLHPNGEGNHVMAMAFADLF